MDSYTRADHDADMTGCKCEDCRGLGPISHDEAVRLWFNSSFVKTRSMIPDMPDWFWPRVMEMGDPNVSTETPADYVWHTDKEVTT